MKHPLPKIPIDVIVGEVGLRLLDAVAKNPQGVVDLAVSCANVYVSRQHNEYMGWLRGLTSHGNESVRTSAAALLKALDAAGVKPALQVAPRIPLAAPR